MSNASKNKAAQAAQVKQAAALIRKEIAQIGEQLRTAEGEAKDQLQTRMRELMDSIGMSYDVESPVSDFFQTDLSSVVPGIGNTLRFKTTAPTDAPADEVEMTVDPETDSDAKPSYWTRFTAFLSRNRYAVIGGVCAVLAGGAALYVWLRNGSGTTPAATVEQSAFMRGTDTVEGTDATVMAKIGNFFASIWTAVVKYTVAAKDWVVGLFSKSEATVAAETVAAEAAEVVAAAADAVPA